REAEAASLPPGVIPYDSPEALLDSVEIDPTGCRILAWFVARERDCQGRTIAQPIFPGSRLGDCFYLAFSILVGQSTQIAERTRQGFMGVRALDRNFRYRRPIRPHDRVRLDVELTRRRGRTLVARGRATVGDDVVFEADELWISLVPPAPGPDQIGPPTA